MTQQELQELLSYDPTTGIFRWLESRGGKTAGDTAGAKHHTGYIEIGINQRRYYAHRLAYLYMMGEMPNSEMDHINKIGDDNRWSNLRQASRSQNNANRNKPRNNKSGYRGVCWHKRHKKWLARIGYGGKKIYLGYYDTPKEAHEAYKIGAIKYYGEYASV